MAQSDIYQAIGGKEACGKLSAAFYARVAQDPLLRPFFPGKSFRCAIEAFAAFLAQFLGGPPEDAEARWWLSLRESHLRFSIGQKERDAWMKDMIQALDDAGIEEPVRSALRGLFEQSSAYLVNRGEGVSSTETQGGPLHQELASRWDGQRRLDEAVSAVRRGDTERAIRLAGGFQQDRVVFVRLLALMVGAGAGAMLDYVRGRLLDDPALTQLRYSRRTLLHGAAGAGSLSMVELLLQLGADPNAKDGGGHAPLYSVGNECLGPRGGEVVRALVRAGASVDACDGVKRCTALHMAARRGNAEVAAALLDCGAQIEARDSLQETPLRRAVNCGKTKAAALLIARGADIHSKGSKGLTASQAARTRAMRELFEFRGASF